MVGEGSGMKGEENGRECRGVEGREEERRGEEMRCERVGEWN